MGANPTNLIRVMPAEGDEMRTSPDLRALAQGAADVLSRLRAKSPRVHCITNTVAQAFTANVLLAAGAQPSMTISPEEIGHFAGGADALLVNLGTFDRERAAAIDIAIAAATAAKRPWVLDPVLIDRSPPRAALARELLKQRPTTLRLNAAEFAALANGQTPAEFATAHSTVVALSGATDVVASADHQTSLANGHPLMARITAMGCAGSALIAACLAVENDPWLASVAGVLILGVAGEIVGEGWKGPGSFAVAILDALYHLEPGELAARAKVS
jgi:hydroxyethylthiazole kinase